ncbi:capsid protein VP2 [avian adeno-associated virus BR_DF12]|uniref:Capsid protein VP2 n=1 Tax=avian adeno-associated virus BR_DF12 TaxID=3070174 RepID=A0A5C0PZD0_9VIRU|nr:capsid protein VP2 [Avian adeno-associated virus]QEJ80810.1 capsid protein VP2 [avian adeno-associated virus BR_DF12]
MGGGEPPAPPPIEEPKGVGGAENGNATGGGAGAEGSPVSGAASIMAGGAGAPMADNNQGADGVGESAGNWHCDSKWMGDHVLTTTTRTWVLPPYNNYLYRAITSTGTDRNQAYAGFSTPWGFFDFNRFHCHFSPRDWQRLVNNHVGFRPRGMRVKIFNIQVKEVTMQDNQKTIANNLTSTVQIFADSEYLLPYVNDCASESALPPFPADIYQVPQYGYLTYHWQNANNNIEYTDRSAFYCLEYFPSSMLRTGNTFDFTFEFEDVPFHSSYAHSQFLDRIHNPLIDQYLWGIYEVSNKTAKWKKIDGSNCANRYRNWCKGPYVRDQRIRVYPGGAANYTTFSAWNAGAKAHIQDREYLFRPGISGPGTDLTNTSHVACNNNLTFAKKPQNTPANPTIDDLMITDESETLPTNPVVTKAWGAAANNAQDDGHAPAREEINDIGVLPGMCWQNRDCYLQGPIWAKIPDTENHFNPAPHMGGFGLKKPPPQIFIKPTPVPADPPATYSNAKWNSYINQYATGQITVEIVWEVQKESSKRWNPEIQFTSNFGNAFKESLNFAPNKDGDYNEPRLIGTRWLSKHL